MCVHVCCTFTVHGWFVLYVIPCGPIFETSLFDPRMYRKIETKQARLLPIRQLQCPLKNKKCHALRTEAMYTDGDLPFRPLASLQSVTNDTVRLNGIFSNCHV
jgi:hypothetical protein